MENVFTLRLLTSNVPTEIHQNLLQDNPMEGFAAWHSSFFVCLF